MDSWNYVFICMGVVVIMGTILRRLSGKKNKFRNEKYFRKLELKYGYIDRGRTIKLDIFYNYLLGMAYVLIGLSIRDMISSIIVLIVTSVIMILVYYLLRKKYILA